MDVQMDAWMLAERKGWLYGWMHAWMRVWIGSLDIEIPS